MIFIWILITLQAYERCTYIYGGRSEVNWTVAAVAANNKL